MSKHEPTNPFMNDVDRSLGTVRYALTIIRGRSFQVTEVIHHVGDDEHTLEGDFVLTVGKRAVILTRDGKPVIVKRWRSIPLEDHVTLATATPFLLSGVKIAEAYRDSNGWLWEAIVASDGNSFQVQNEEDLLFTISFQ